MARSSAYLPRYRKHRASGQAVVTLNGRDHYLGPHGTQASRTEYDRLIAQWLASGRQPFWKRSNELTVCEVAARYWTYAKRIHVKGDRPTAELTHVKVTLRSLLELYRDVPVVEFGPLALRTIQDSLVAAGLARSTVNARVARIKQMFKWAVAEEFVPVEVHQALATVAGLRRGRTTARETAPVLPVDEATVAATLPHLPATVADMVRLQRLTGCRPAEVCLMRPCDIDRSGDVWQYRPPSHKTAYRGRERVIFIGPQAQEILLKYLAREANMCCFRPVDSEARRLAERHAARRTPLSCGNRPGTNRRRTPKHAAGESYDVDAYRRAIHRACDHAFPPEGELAKRSGETNQQRQDRLNEAQRGALARWCSDHRWSPNQLRHAAGTDVRKRFGLEAAQVILGHSQAQVTQIYAERDHALGARVAAAVG